MTRYSERLLAQALHLAKRDRFRPAQVNLRRAVSSAYYALFHALVYASCGKFVGRGEDARALRLVLSRSFTHTEMQRASRAFAQGQNGLPPVVRLALDGAGVSTSLRDLAELFQCLQEDRHTADYDLAAQWRRGDVLVQITAVESCLQYLRRDRTAKDLRAYLTSILVWNRISNR